MLERVLALASASGPSPGDYATTRSRRDGGPANFEPVTGGSTLCAAYPERRFHAMSVPKVAILVLFSLFISGFGGTTRAAALILTPIRTRRAHIA